MKRYKLKTVRVSLACETADQAQITEPAEARLMLDAIYLKERLDADKEHFVVLALDARGRPMGYKVIGTGTASSTLVHPREVFKPLIHMGAHSFIAAHNHPSGDPSPSDEDLALTERLERAGQLLGIPMVDHLVLTTREARSLVKS